MRVTDPKAAVYLHHRDDLVAVARAVVGSADIAEDVVQDCWLRWSGHDYEADRARAVLRRIVRNLALDWRRRRRVECEAVETQRLHLHGPLNAEHIVSARQELARVIEALDQLPPRTLRAFRLARVEGRTLKEVGRRMEVSEVRVSQLVSDAMVRIIAALEG